MYEGWKRYRDDSDPRVRARVEADARKLRQGYGATLWAMERYLPASFLNQTKQGFSPPDANWYRGPSMDYIKSVLWDPRARARPWFDQDSIDAVLGEHFEGRRNNRLLIWSLLSFECLQRHWDGTAPAAARARAARGAVEVHVP